MNKASVITIYVSALLLLSHFTQCREEELQQCSQYTSPSLNKCINSDSVGSRTYFPGESVKEMVDIQLDLQTLNKLWANESLIRIETSGGRKVSTGKKFLSDQDRDRLELEFHFQKYDNGSGSLMLLLSNHNVMDIDDVGYCIKLEMEHVTFVTPKKSWFHVGDPPTMGISPADEQCAIKQAKVEELEARLKETTDKLSDNQDKYIHCLESKHEKGDKGLQTVVSLIFILTLVGMAVYMYRHYKTEKWIFHGTGNRQEKTVKPNTTLIICKE